MGCHRERGGGELDGRQPGALNRGEGHATRHKQSKARAGEGEVDSVDVIEPVHIRTFFSRHFSGRPLSACDPDAVMLHAAVLMGMCLMLRFNELSSLTMEHLGRSEGHFTLSIPTGTKTQHRKQKYELTPWPTCIQLDPRYVFEHSILLSC